MTAWTKSIFLVQRRMDERDHQFDSETKIQDFNEVASTMYRKFLNQPDTKQLKQNARALMKRYKVYLQENKGMSLVNDVDRILRQYAILHCGIISWMDNNGYTVDFDIDESLFQYVVAVCLPEVIRLSAKSNKDHLPQPNGDFERPDLEEIFAKKVMQMTCLELACNIGFVQKGGELHMSFSHGI